MSYTLCLLAAGCLAGQVQDVPPPEATDAVPCVPAQGYNTPPPPHQPLWTCSSALRWHNRMTCHEVGEVRLPFLDFWSGVFGKLCPQRHDNPVRYEGVNTSFIYGAQSGPLFYAPSHVAADEMQPAPPR